MHVLVVVLAPCARALRFRRAARHTRRTHCSCTAGDRLRRGSCIRTCVGDVAAGLGRAV